MSARKGHAQESFFWASQQHQQNDPNNTNSSINIVVSDHDVLSGRGVNIAQHAGNERFRALVQSRHDANYCHEYSTAEKRAVAESIVQHIKTALDPPGRFLRRSGKSNRSVRGLDGPWEELSREEEIKKTCQALRDCNRQDRAGYAAAVSVPDDVHFSEHLRIQSGMTNKQLAEMAVAQSKQEAEHAAVAAAAGIPLKQDNNFPNLAKKRSRDEAEDETLARILTNDDDLEPNPIDGGGTVDSALLMWPKKDKLDSTPVPHATTPATAASSGGLNSRGRSGEDTSSSEHSPSHFMMDFSPDEQGIDASMLPSHLDQDTTSSSPNVASNLSFHHHEDVALLQAHFASDNDDDRKPLAVASEPHDHPQQHHLDFSSSQPDDSYHGHDLLHNNTYLADHHLQLCDETAADIGNETSHLLPPLHCHHHHSLLLSLDSVTNDGCDPEDFGPPSPLHPDPNSDSLHEDRDHSF